MAFLSIASDNDDPGHVAMKAFNQLVYQTHPYRWPVQGTEETLHKISLSDIQSFYPKEYLPNQVILTIVGDVTVEQATSLVQVHFGSWKKGLAPPRPVRKPPSVDKKTVQFIEKDLTQSTIVLGHSGITRTNPDFYAVTVMNHVLGAGGFSSRLMDSIRDKQGLAYGITSHYDAKAMPGSFWINLQTRTETTNQAISSVLAEMKAIREAPVTEFDAEKYEDQHRQRVMELVNTKAEGKDITVAAPQAKRAQVIDLMAALKESLGRKSNLKGRKPAIRAKASQPERDKKRVQSAKK